MTISVIIPTFCSERFVKETLESVFAQTKRPEEVIVVDDASADRTAELVREIAATAPVRIRLEILPKNSGGPSAPTNRGLELARGDFIALLDHDDLFLPEKLALQAAVLQAHPEVDLVMSDYEHIGLKGVLNDSDARQTEPDGHAILFAGEADEVRIIDQLTCLKALVKRPGLALSCSNYFFRTALWRRVGGLDHSYMPVADYDFLLRAADRPVAWVDRKLFRKRIHQTNHWRMYVEDPARKWRSEATVARAQGAMLKRGPRDRELKRFVANHTGYVAHGLIGIGKRKQAFIEAIRLFRLGCFQDFARVLAGLLQPAGRAGWSTHAAHRTGR